MVVSDDQICFKRIRAQVREQLYSWHHEAKSHSDKLRSISHRRLTVSEEDFLSTIATTLARHLETNDGNFVRHAYFDKTLSSEFTEALDGLLMITHPSIEIRWDVIFGILGPVQLLHLLTVWRTVLTLKRSVEGAKDVLAVLYQTKYRWHDNMTVLVDALHKCFMLPTMSFIFLNVFYLVFCAARATTPAPRKTKTTVKKLGKL